MRDQDSRISAIFDREFHWQRPGSPLGFGAMAAPHLQTFPRDFIAAAIKAGAARPVPKHGATLKAVPAASLKKE